MADLSCAQQPRGETTIELVLMTAPIAVAAALLRGGSLRQLAELELAHTWLVFVGLVIQIAGVTVLSSAGASFGWILVIGTTVPLIAFFLVNQVIPGARWVALGFVLNLVVIAANGAMPVSRQAAEAAGVPITPEIQGPRHEILDENTILPWLGDVIPLPPLNRVVSIGDLWLALAIAYLLYRATQRPARHSIRRASGSEPEAEL